MHRLHLLPSFLSSNLEGLDNDFTQSQSSPFAVSPDIDASALKLDSATDVSYSAILSASHWIRIAFLSPAKSKTTNICAKVFENTICPPAM